jgi:hypothetical protein
MNRVTTNCGRFEDDPVNRVVANGGSKNFDGTNR